MSAKHATTSAPIIDTLNERWSPRAFDTDYALSEDALRSAFEAARWSASANNAQPWRFIVARRGTEAFAKIEQALVSFNAAWATSASALIVNVAELATADGAEQRWAEYDLGQAVAQFAVQAHSAGLHVHQMGGFDPAQISAAFDLDDRFRPVSVTSIGKLGAPEQLVDALKERELAPRERADLDSLFIVNE